ncbi:MAG: TolC family protein [Acidobacteriota bacterium]|nr:TolC family protein [Acidobacteriota bacterium]
MSLSFPELPCRLSGSRPSRLPCLLAALVVVGLVASSTAGAADGEASPKAESSPEVMSAPAAETPERKTVAALLAATEPAALRLLAEDVLRHSPEVARRRAEAAAAAARAPQAGSLPDPSAMLTLFALPPETRVGPQRVAVSVSQAVPWPAKLALGERAALWSAAAAGERVEAARLATLAHVRERFYQLAFTTERLAIAERERVHLLRHEELARARYAAGQGSQQGVVKIQAEITRAEQRLLEVEERRRALAAELNALRERPHDADIDGLELPRPMGSAESLTMMEESRLSVFDADRLDAEELIGRAWERRPERRALAAEGIRRRLMVEVAEAGYRPDFTVGLGYTLVDRRQDAAGQLNPPEGDGDDIVALSAGVRLPVRRGRLAAALEEALQQQSVVAQEERQLRQDFERTIGDLVARLPLLYDQWQLFENVLVTQAEEAVRAAEGAYSSGTVGALELLDAEHVLFEVATGEARARLELALAWTRLETAVGGPLGGLRARLESSARKSDEMTSKTLEEPMTGGTQMVGGIQTSGGTP